MTEADAIKYEMWTLCGLHDALYRDVAVCLQWLAKRSLIANSRPCDVCGRPMTLNSCEEQEGVDRKHWSCQQPCNRRLSVRKGSFFESSSLELITIVKLIYLWAADFLQDFAMLELDVSNKTVVDWFNIFREECQKFVADNDSKLHPYKASFVIIIIAHITISQMHTFYLV